MARRTEPVQCESPMRQWMAAAHDTDILAVVEALVGERHGLADLRPGRQIAQHGGKKADRQIGGLVVQ